MRLLSHIFFLVPFLRLAHKQHMCVFTQFGHTHSLHWRGFHTLIIIHDTPQQNSSPISPGILHLLASFIFLQPSPLRCVHSLPDQHTFNYQHIIKSRDKPGGPSGTLPSPCLGAPEAQDSIGCSCTWTQVPNWS